MRTTLSGRPRLEPLPVGWMASPSVPHLQLSAHEDLVASPTVVSLFATFVDGSFARVQVEFRDALWVRWSPSHSDLEVVAESDYDWSGVPRLEVGPAYQDSALRLREQWRASGICPDSRVYEVGNSPWVEGLGHPTAGGLAHRHFLVLGHDAYVELLATGWQEKGLLDGTGAEELTERQIG